MPGSERGIYSHDVRAYMSVTLCQPYCHIYVHAHNMYGLGARPNAHAYS